MTLREKFDKIEVNIEEGLSGIIYLNDIEAEECEQVAEDFAIGFGEYLDSLTAEDMGTLSIKELLEIYKKTL